MKKRKLSRRFGFESLEGRRLLAADFCMQAIPEVDSIEPAQCEVAAFDCPAAAAVSDSIAESVPVAEAETAPELDPRVLDLADGMDGYFGALNAENPTESLEFTAAGNGMVDVVLASSFGNAHASLSVTNSQGEVIETQGQGLEGFDMLSFEVEEGETYQLSISSDNANCDGHFQLTAGFTAHVDQHADALGSESTELELAENRAELSGRLESAGDIDTFRFTATSTGEMTLELHETVDDARIGLGVSIQDAEGNMLAEGATNEMLQISFDVSEGQEYFVSLAAGEGQTGTYNFGLELTPGPELPIAESVDSDATDAFVDSEATQPQDANPEMSEPEMVAEPTTDNQEGDPSIDDPADLEVIADTDQPEADPDSDLVESSDELLAADLTDAADVIVDPVSPTDCQLGDSNGDTIQTDVTDEPANVEPTDAIAGNLVEQSTDDPEAETGLVGATEDQLEEIAVGEWDDCATAAPIVASDDSAADLATTPILEPGTCDLIADSGTEVTVGETEIDQPLVSFDEQDAVDDFFAELGNDFELHFDLSFGPYSFESVFSLV